MKTIACSNICMDLQELFIRRSPWEGRIHSIFASSLNILVKDDKQEGFLVTLLAEDRPMAQHSIRRGENVSNRLAFNKLALSVGEPVHFFDRYALAGTGEKVLRIFYGQAGGWSARPQFPLRTAEPVLLGRRMERLRRFLYQHEADLGIGDLLYAASDSWTELKPLFREPRRLMDQALFILPRFVRFLDLYRRSLLSDIDPGLQEAARGVIGFGPGLTPSMDDFLSGLMVAAVYGTSANRKNLEKMLLCNRKIVAGNLTRTTPVSAEMLRFSAEGRVNAYLKELMSLLFNPDQTEQESRKINRCLEEESSLGASSGQDTLYGVYVGCYLIKCLKEVECE